MKPSGRRRALPPLDEGKLNALALRYVERFATTRAKLRVYLSRKIRERGWDGEGEPALEAISDRFAELGYVSDEAYAVAKSQALTGRGYGRRRVQQTLRAAGVDEESGARALDHARSEAVAAALRFAKRRRIGPFAPNAVEDRRERDKALAAMIRAGHEFELSKAVISLAPGEELNADQLTRLVDV